MNSKHRARLLAAAEPLLQPSERVEVTGLAKVGKAPVKANTAALAASVTAGAVLGVGVAFAQRETYLVLTDRRLIFFAALGVYGPGKYQGSLARETITPTVLKDGVFVKLQLDSTGADAPIRLTFPPMPPSLRVHGRALAAALASTAPRHARVT
jgi:hypothetical protein